MVGRNVIANRLARFLDEDAVTVKLAIVSVFFGLADMSVNVSSSPQYYGYDVNVTFVTGKLANANVLDKRLFLCLHKGQLVLPNQLLLIGLSSYSTCLAWVCGRE